MQNYSVIYEPVPLMNMKHIIIILIVILTTNSASAENQTSKTERVQSIRSKNIKIFEEINIAFHADDLEKVKELLDYLSLGFTSANKDKLHQFNASISSGKFIEAKEIASKLFENNELSEVERVRIHKFLGDAYFQRNNLDEALSEYKKVLELFDK